MNPEDIEYVGTYCKLLHDVFFNARVVDQVTHLQMHQPPLTVTATVFVHGPSTTAACPQRCLHQSFALTPSGRRPHRRQQGGRLAAFYSSAASTANAPGSSMLFQVVSTQPS